MKQSDEFDTSLKDEGNRLYGEKKYVEATAKYGDAIGRLEQLMLR